MQTLPTVSLYRRLLALLYEGLLLSAVTFLAAIVAGIITLIHEILPWFSSLLVSLLLPLTWRFYFKLNWYRQKSGQTLSMRVWKIALVNQHNQRPSLSQLRLRFMCACIFIVFVPLLAYLDLRQILLLPPKIALGLALLLWILPWDFVFFNQDHQFLYDYLANTRLVNLK